jgi:hypothetical protein
MEGCCLDHFLPTANVMNHLRNGGEYEINPKDTKRVFHLHSSDSKLENAATTTCHITSLLDLLFHHRIMQQVLCDTSHVPVLHAWLTQLSHHWTPNMDKLSQPCYAIEPLLCKYSSILSGYNKWYITELNIHQDSTTKQEVQEMHKGVLMGMTQVSSEDIEEGLFGAFQTSGTQMLGYYIVQWIGNPYTLQEVYASHLWRWHYIIWVMCTVQSLSYDKNICLYPQEWGRMRFCHDVVMVLYTEKK